MHNIHINYILYIISTQYIKYILLIYINNIIYIILLIYKLCICWSAQQTVQDARYVHYSNCTTNCTRRTVRTLQ